MTAIDKLKQALQSTYGIQSLNTPDLESAIAEAEQLREQVGMFEATTKHQDGLLVKMKGQYDKLRTERNVVQMELDQITEYSAKLESDNDKLRARVAELETFVSMVAKQTPEKPDYWTSCGQCDSNIDDAEELMESNQIEGGE